MGSFTLGVLVGWLLEWLFFKFWVKGVPSQNQSSVNSADLNSLKSELSSKNAEIAALKSKLYKAEENASSAQASSAAEDSSSEKSEPSTQKVEKKSTKESAPVKQKATAKKKAPVKKKAPAKAKKAKGDNFLKLAGVGPSLSSKLNEIGLTTFSELAAMDDDDLRAKLEAVGARLNSNKDVMDSLNEQATLAANGEFDKLKALQASMKK